MSRCLQGRNSAKTDRERDLAELPQGSIQPCRVVHAFVELSNCRDLSNCRVAKGLRRIHLCRVACNSALFLRLSLHTELPHNPRNVSILHSRVVKPHLEAVYLLITGLLLYLAQSELLLQLAKSEAPSRVVTHLLI